MFESNWDPYEQLIQCQGHVNQIQNNIVEVAMGMNNHAHRLHELLDGQRNLEQQIRLLRAEMASYRLEQQKQSRLPLNTN